MGLQSPGKEAADGSGLIEPPAEGVCAGVVGAFAQRLDRVLGWDVWNEPDNRGLDSEEDVAAKVKRVDELLPKVFEWARAAHPTQPLTSGVWRGNWVDPDKESETTKIQLAESDVISFHNYDWPEIFEARVKELERYHRPLICTEYMARGNGSTFDTVLPVAKRYHVAAINWGLVAGKTQTYLPWDSWQRPYVTVQPPIWFHDVFRLRMELPIRGKRGADLNPRVDRRAWNTGARGGGGAVKGTLFEGAESWNSRLGSSARASGLTRCRGRFSLCLGGRSRAEFFLDHTAPSDTGQVCGCDRGEGRELYRRRLR